MSRRYTVLHQDGTSSGPMTREALQALCKQSRIAPNDVISDVVTNKSCHASKVRGLNITLRDEPGNTAHWYYKIGNADQGPHVFAQIQELVNSGTIVATTMIKRLDSDWRYAREWDIIEPLLGFPQKTVPATAKHESTVTDAVLGAVSITVIAVVMIALLSSPRSPVDAGTNNAKSKRHSQVVRNDGWRGGVSQVQEWFRTNLHDHSSLQVIEWGTVRSTPAGNYYVRVRYRARNQFGAMVIQTSVFYFDSSGRITNVEQL